MPGESGITAFEGLGEIAPIPGLRDVQVLEPRTMFDATPNTYSGIFGVQDFPLHTDLAHWFVPPRYFALRCVIGARRVFTRLVDSKELIPIPGRHNLSRALVRPRRPLKENRPLLRLLSWAKNGEALFRWDSLFVVPATPESQAICTEFSHVLNSARTLDVLLENPGDTLILDNWRIVHGRSPVSKEEETRKIERAYFGAIH